MSHRFSNRWFVRNQINQQAGHESLPVGLLELRIPLKLRYQLRDETKRSIRKVVR